MHAHSNAHRQLSASMPRRAKSETRTALHIASKRAEVTERRERRYPFLTALDLLFHFAIGAAMCALSGWALLLAINTLAPDLPHRIAFFFGQLF